MEDRTRIPQPKSPIKSFINFKNIVSEKEHGFTLIEIIIVIIIVGILAAVGINQYSKMVEKGRGAEMRQIFGHVRSLINSYRLENGTITGMTNADVNIGASPDQIPSSCRSTHYFRYSLANSGGAISSATDPIVQIAAWRCTSGGKTPQGPANYPPSCPGCRISQIELNFTTGVDTWSDPYGAGY